MKKIISSVLALCMAFTSVVFTTVHAANLGNTAISAAGACVMDYETGDILYSHNGDTPRVPASMTKIMNLYCVYEALANGEITLNTKVPISKSVYNKSRNSLYQSVLPLNYNTTYTVNEMIDVVIVHSASGAAVALAELVGNGSEAAFVTRMNNKAKEMGINAYYYDSCGIANNQVSPIAMATLARNIIKDYPDILTRSAKKSVYFHGGNYRTTNHLLDTYYYQGADGLKTGTTSASGYCFCGTAVRNGRRMISVVMRSASTGQRFIDTARLLDYGFAAARDKYDTIYFTDMRTFLDGNEMPTFAYDGGNPRAMVVAEDLKDYGFDVSYDWDTKTVYIKRNTKKAPTPIPMDFYRNKNGQKAFYIADDDSVSVIINDGVSDHKLSDIHNVSGYMCISIDELGKIFNFKWDTDTNSATITTK